MELKVIARIENGFSQKFGIPRQSGLSSIPGKIVFEPAFRSHEAIRGITGFSHLWLIWGFSEGFASGGKPDFSPTVRPPRLGGNMRVGVFASRSPNRPNPIGLSAVKLVGVEKTDRGDVLLIEGADLMNGTPIYDIKPYLSFADALPNAVCGFADDYSDYRLGVDIPENIAQNIQKNDLAALRDILKNDPRPSYQNDPEREYFFDYGGLCVGFRVENGVAKVTSIERK